MNFFIALILVIAEFLNLSSLKSKLEKKLINRLDINIVSESKQKIRSFPFIKDRSFNFRVEGALVVDLGNDYIVAEKNKDKKRPIASLTKIIASLVLVKNNKIEEEIEIPESTCNLDWSCAHFKSREKFKAKDLIKAMLITSANDAVLALEKGLKDFDLVKEMNNEAQKLGLVNTYFKDSAGLSEENVSTPWELYLLTKEFLKYDFLKKTGQTKEERICDISGESCYVLETTNRLNRQGFLGIKTGYTEEAGHCLITLKNIKDKYPTLIIVLGGADGHIRFEDVELSADWLENYAIY